MFTFAQLEKLSDCLVLLDTLYSCGEVYDSENDYQESISMNAIDLLPIVQRQMMQMKLEKEKVVTATNENDQFENTY